MISTVPRVGIVVLNYNGQACLNRCLRSLDGLRYENFFVLVVDNASTDDSLATARQSFPEHTYICNIENKGFAAGMNSGLRTAFERGAAWVWLFNNDAEAEAPALTSLMTVAVKDERIGLLSPWIFWTGTKKLWFGKGRIDQLRMRALHVVPNSVERHKAWYESEFLTGCALLIKKEVYQEVGALDEHFFLYYEDADLSLRARQKGFLVGAVPAAHVFHAEQSSENPQKLYHLVLSGLIFFEKHASPWLRPYYYVYATMRRLKNHLTGLMGKEVARSVRRAYKDYYGN